MPTSTVEDYLKTILLEESTLAGERVPMGQIASALRVAPGTVTAMMRALSDGGLVDYEPRGGVRLTSAGRQLATHVLRRHRLIELFLVQAVGLDWSEVHDEAELLEHAVSERVIERIDELLGHPSVDPHGDPIPSRSGVVEIRERPSLVDCAVGAPQRVVRVTDQAAEFLRLVERSRLMPGSRVTVASRDAAADTVALELDGGAALSLGHRAASKILVEPVRKR
jgi:DtxR family transcriptional regulator, Mn-dependent transcriptional regulator